MTPAASHSPWRGQWIWSEDIALTPPGPGLMLGAPDPARFDRRVLFRRSFDLADVPATAPFRITADSRYVLWVNGTEVSRGPVRHGPRGLTYDTGDAAAALRAGRNTVAVLARFYGHATPWWEPSPWTYTLGGGCLVAELQVADDEFIATGADWQCHDGDAWSPQQPRSGLFTQLPEILDARRLDPDWQRPDATAPAHGWAPVRVLAAHVVVGPGGDARPPSEPFGALTPRPLPAPARHDREPVTFQQAQLATAEGESDGLYATLAAAVTAVADAEPRPAGPPLGTEGPPVVLLADFGRVVHGRLRFAADAAEGALISGSLLELPTRAALDSANAFRYTARGHADTFETSDPVGGRYALLVLRGPGPVRLRSLTVREELRPRPDGPYFACSDDALNTIHRVALRTVDLCAHDAYVDCPTREQRAWTGDFVVSQSVDLVTNPDWSLARHHPRLAAQPRQDGLLRMVSAGDFAQDPVPTIPDWSLHWIRSVHHLYRYTGDRDLVAGLLATAEPVLRWFLPFQGPDGLLADVTGWVLIDWSPVQVAGTSAALNALWARGLADFAEMAEWLGDTGRARWARDLIAQVAAGFEEFWDAGRGAYRDHRVDGTVREAVSEHTQAAAVCAGLVPKERYPAVRALLLDRAAMFTSSPMSHRGSDSGGPLATAPVSTRDAPDWDTGRLVVGAQPFFRYVVHDALALLGAADRIERLCGDWTALLAEGPTAFRECWEGGSSCHGWSATPGRDLLVHTLGVTPAEPGYTTVRIAPALGTLSWARGAVPTPHGLVHVEVNGDRLHVEAPVPVVVDHPDATTTRHRPGTFDTTLRHP
ncbi:alpha-L-rhamnosidase C-terminal domain-containing protein [Streptomyces griseoviridis]